MSFAGELKGEAERQSPCREFNARHRCRRVERQVECSSAKQ